MPIAAAVVGDLRMRAVLAAHDMAAESRRAAALDRAHHLHLAEAHMAGIGTTPSRSVVAKDIRNLQNWTHHDRGGLCGRIVLGLILLGHQRREAIQWAHDRADGVGGRGRQHPRLTAEPVVIDYETFCKIHDSYDRQGLTIAQTARTLGLHPQTVATWVARSRFEPRRSRPRSSVLDPFKPRIIRLLDSHPYSAQQIFQRLREEGYRGGVTILRDYVRCIRPTKRPVYLKLHFVPGECAQVDWGAYGTVAVGNTRRRLSFFVMVLAFSRQMFVEFTVSQTMEHFLACHEHGFAALGVPSKIMVDNLKSAVL